MTGALGTGYHDSFDLNVAHNTQKQLELGERVVVKQIRSFVHSFILNLILLYQNFNHGLCNTANQALRSKLSTAWHEP